ncbi:adenylate/guanylate cyclase domain-containing protein [Bradyrhizobium sp. LHD-71]|nr:adenylate/guanylate cyclase domain-containing protein [Bradyrhizobium sp. LHD-71]MDQ8731569.1 adenylate/guanylate cyclase domain-containing protein [Bradyrhizobium sp. LHD-71]
MVDEIQSWVVARGLAGGSETDLLAGFCRKCREGGLLLSHGLVIIDTLHPTYEGRAFRWQVTPTNESPLIEYGPTKEGEAAANWQRSPFFHLLEAGETEFRSRIALGDSLDFTNLQRLKDSGHTDYIAFVNRFDADGTIGEMDAVYSHWTTDIDAGFCQESLQVLRELVPSIALAIKCISLGRVAATLVDVYLGRQTGRRVLQGQMTRGVAERIHAALWYSDLRDFTSISEQIAPEEIIPLLNDYAEAVISSVQAQTGEVLKLMGDGVLAIFTGRSISEACRAALDAEESVRKLTGELSQRRATEGKPTTSVYLGLHVGDVFYGNIGSDDRLDFTVIGPAVNEVCRIATMCRSAGQLTLTSTEFGAAARAADRPRLVSVGRYALRGVERPKELFTIDRFFAGRRTH